MKKIFIFLIASLACCDLFAQREYFEGPQTVYVGQTITYWYLGTSGSGSWSIMGSGITNQGSDADYITIYISSSASSSFYLGHSNSEDGYKELFINVYTAPPTPPNPYIASSQCGQVTLQMHTSQIPPDVEWYWQTTPNGQSTGLGTYYQRNVTSSGTYYLQSRSSFTGVWGGTSSGLPVTVPAVPPAPPNNSNSRCGSGSISLTTSPGSGNSLKWYNASTGGTLLHTGTTYSPSISTTTTFYASAYNTTTGCQSTSRAAITGTVVQPPSPGVLSSNNPSDQVCIGGSLQISVSGNGGTPYYWISSNNGASWDMEDAANLGDPFNYTFNTAGLWIIRTQSEATGGCWSTSEETIQIEVRNTPLQPSVTPGSRCGSGSVTLSASSGTYGTSVRWYEFNSGGSVLSTNNSYATPSLSASKTYYVSSYYSVAGCESTRRPVTATINSVPSAPAAGGNSRCLSGVINLTTPPGSGNSLKWYNASSGGTLLHTGTTYSPNLSTTTTFYASAYNTTTGCESTSRAAVTGTIVQPPSPGVLSSNNASDQVCIGGSLQISVSGNGGTPYYWISSNNGASWDMEDAANLGDPFNYTFNTPGLWIIRTQSEAAGGCWSTSEETIQIEVRDTPLQPSVTPASRCGEGSVTLSASAGTYGTSVRWYEFNSGGSVLSTNNSYPTPSLSASKTYYVSSYYSVAGCESTRRPVTATINPIPPIPPPGNNTRCESGVINLTTPPGSGNSLKWYSALTGGTLLHTGTTYSPNLSTTTTFYASAYNTATGCENTSRAVVTGNIVQPPSPGVLYSSNPSDQVCVGGSLEISVSENGGTPYYWISSNNGASWDMEDASNRGNPFTYTFNTEGLWLIMTKSEISPGSCWSTSEETLQIYVTPTPGPPVNITGDSNCGPGSITLSASKGDNGHSVRWYDTGTSTPVLSSNNTLTVPDLVQTKHYYVATYNSVAVCDGARVPVLAEIVDVPGQPTVTGNHRMGPGTLSLTASGAPNGSSYHWYDPGNTPLFTGSSYTTPGVETNTDNYVYVQAVNKQCPGGTTWVDAILEPLPVIVATPEWVIRGGDVVLDAGPGYTTYVWKNENGDVIGNDRTITTNTPGIYYVTVTKAGIAGEGTSSYRLRTQIEGQDLNYIVINTVQDKGIQDENILQELTAEMLRQTVHYFNGLGRMMQTVTAQGSPDKKDVVQPVRYDGLGREMLKYLPFPSDENTGRYKPDPVGEVAEDYLGSDQYQFYVDLDSRPFSEIEFEPSPLNRPAKTFGPGNDWKVNNKYIANQYLTNIHGTGASETAEKVISWKITDGLPKRGDVLSGYVVAGGYYNSGQLIIVSTIDEQGNEVREYTDKAGRTVLKKVQVISPVSDLNSTAHWALTYYIYDDFGTLWFVLQPVLSAALHENDTNEPSVLDLNKLAFQYKYDDRQRLIEKRVPGAEPIYLVYDEFDRLVLTQNGNQRKDENGDDKTEWSFTKYDALNRPVISGTYTHAAVLNQAEMDGEVVTGNESYNGVVVTNGYTNVVFPTSNTEVLTVNYYDDDSFKSMITEPEFSTGEVNYKSDVFIDQYKYDAAGNSFPYLKGLLTGTKIKILNQGKYLWTINYFDDYSRIVQSISSNDKNGVDRLTNRYDFTGKVIQSQTSHRAGSSIHTITRNYEYDHAGRMRKIWHKVDDNPEVILTGFDYNEVGEVVAKKLHAVADPAIGQEGTVYNGNSVEVSQYNNEESIIARNSVILKPGFTVPAGKTFVARTEKTWNSTNSDPPDNAYVQVVNYSYNIRGWLAEINDVDEPGNDMFTMKLNYNSPTSTGGVPQFNGNVREIQWGAAGAAKQSYTYTYDAMNRLTQAKYFNHVNSDFNDRYNETIPVPTGLLSGYDLNGNILKLQRWGKINDDSYGLMDDLTYKYTNSAGGTGNQVNEINDVVINDPLEQGFKEGAEEEGEYGYDYNGNMKADLNKGITSITYNFLNLPQQVNKGTSDYIVYTYDATGRKLKQEVFGASPKTTEYAGDFIYENNILQSVSHEEGRLLPSSAFPDYEYFMKDHQGSNRVTFKGRSTTSEYLATIEDDRLDDEFTAFENYPGPGSRSSLPIFDHTDAGTVYDKSQLLTGAPGLQIGLAKSFEVKPGDVFDLEVFAKYESSSGTSSDLGTLLAALATTFSLPVTGGAGLESQQAREAFNALFDGNVYIGDEESYEDPAAPKAYLNYVLFDDNFALLDFGFDQVDAGADQNGMHDLLSLNIRVRQNGYLYVFLSNENPALKNVYFDDFRIVRHTAVEQASDYYPFGLTFNSYESGGTPSSKFKFQGQEHIEDLNLGWDSFKWRNHQPDIGRFFNLDPIAEQYAYNSPYAFSENKVINGIELEGLEYFNATSRVGFAMGGNFNSINKYINIERQTYNVTKNILTDIVVKARGYNDPDLTNKLYDSDVEWYAEREHHAKREWSSVSGKSKIAPNPEYVIPNTPGQRAFTGLGALAVLVTETLSVITKNQLNEDLGITSSHARTMMDTWAIVEGANSSGMLPEGFDLKNRIDLANYILDSQLPKLARKGDGSLRDYSKQIQELGRKLYEDRERFLREQEESND